MTCVIISLMIGIVYSLYYARGSRGLARVRCHQTFPVVMLSPKTGVYFNM